MFQKGDRHVLVLAASIRSLEHLLYCFALETELVTVPAKVLEVWASKNFPMPDKQFQYKSSGRPIPYEELDLERPWETFDIQHELTRKGIEKFAADYHATLSGPHSQTELGRSASSLKRSLPGSQAMSEMRMGPGCGTRSNLKPS
jgi:transaldolase